MAEQTVIQIRVDNALKEKVTDVFDRIGIDIPTAVRVFFKAAVREQGLPFSTNVAEKPSEVDQLADLIKNTILYVLPLACDENTTVVLPLSCGNKQDDTE